MPKAPLFSQIRDGLPLWDVEVDDPQSAQNVPLELRLRRLSLPGGDVLALALRIYDVKRKPHLHHLAAPLDRPEVAAWAQALRHGGSVGLVLQRAGWSSVVERRVSPPAEDLAALDAPRRPGPDPEAAISLYLDRYRAGLPRLGQPEAVWDSLSAGPAKPPSWLWIALILLLAAAAWLLR